jgi:hypothetical protein
MTPVITGNIKNAQLLTVEDMLFLYGEVEIDHLQRWQKGDWMCSSLVNEIDKDRKLVYTRNSIYQVDFIPDKISLTIQQFLLVRQEIPASSFVYINDSNRDEMKKYNVVSHQKVSMYENSNFK